MEKGKNGVGSVLAFPPHGSTSQIAEGLYFRVRNGYGCCPLAVAANREKLGTYFYKPFSRLAWFLVSSTGLSAPASRVRGWLPDRIQGFYL